MKISNIMQIAVYILLLVFLFFICCFIFVVGIDYICFLKY